MTGSFQAELVRYACVDPDAPALLAPGRPALSRSALVRKSAGIAHALAAAGLPAGAVVAAVEPDPYELLPMLLGVSAFGAFAPLNPALTPAELEFHLPDLRPSALIVHSLDSPAAAQGRMQDLRIFETRRLLALADAAPAADFPPPPQPDAVALLLHTSATTGRAKLVPLSHRRLQVMADIAARHFELSSRDCLLGMMPLFHLQGLIAALTQFACGGAVVATRGFDAAQFPEWLVAFRPTWYTAGPALHAAILPAARRCRETVRSSSLRFVRSIGARLAPALLGQLEQVLGIPVLEGYGLTETATVACNPLPPGRRKPGSAGPPVGAEIVILGEDGAPLPPGRQGQIAVRGPSVFDGYRDNEEANRLAFRDGWFLTGDLGWLDEDNYLFIGGRLKEMINRGGEKVLPGEVDDALLSHPAVEKAAAFAIPHPTLGEEVAAAVVLRPGAAAPEHELRRHAASLLSPFKVPRRILFLDSLPAGATGKPKRAELAALLASAAPPDLPPETDCERRVARIWERLLNVERPSRHSDFFSLGGDSFALTLLMTELEIEFGPHAAAIDESEFFASPDIATLARLLEGDGGSPRGPAVREKPPAIVLQREGALPPLFCLPGADENPYYFRELAQCLGSGRPFFILRDPRPIHQRGTYTLEQAAARCLESLRSIRPDGPYLLAGHCYGGVLAFETARQLLAAGAPVERLVLFEVPAPGHPKIARHWRRYLRAAAQVLAGRRAVSLRELAEHGKLLARLGRRRLPAPAAVAPPPAHPNVAAMHAYRPKPLSCPVSHFISADETRKTEILDNPLLAWREYVRGPFDVHPTPGPAGSIFRYPHVRALAERLRAVLDVSS